MARTGVERRRERREDRRARREFGEVARDAIRKGVQDGTLDQAKGEALIAATNRPALLVPHLVPPPTFSIRDYHPLWSAFPCRSDKSMAILRRLFRFRSPLLSESRLMSIPQGTEMFQFPWFASTPYVFRC